MSTCANRRISGPEWRARNQHSGGGQGHAILEEYACAQLLKGLGADLALYLDPVGFWQFKLIRSIKRAISVCDISLGISRVITDGSGDGAQAGRPVSVQLAFLPACPIVKLIFAPKLCTRSVNSRQFGITSGSQARKPSTISLREFWVVPIGSVTTHPAPPSARADKYSM